MNKRQRLVAPFAAGSGIPRIVCPRAESTRADGQRDPHRAPPSAQGTFAAASAPSDDCIGFLSLPLEMQHVIVAEAGRAGGGVRAVCKALRRVALYVLHSPQLFARYCLASGGPRHAVRNALQCFPGMLRGLRPEDGEQRLRALLRAVVQAGGEIRSRPYYHISDVIPSGCAGVLDEYLQLLAAAPSDPERGLKGGLAPHVAEFCTALARSYDWRQGQAMTREMVGLLVRAVEAGAGVRPADITFITALREASCTGAEGALEGLLEAAPPKAAVKEALYFAVKTSHAGTVERLIAAAGEGALAGYVPLQAWWGGVPGVIRAVAQGLQRAGAWGPQEASRALLEMMSFGYPSYRSDEILAERAAAMSMLVHGFGADPASDGAAVDGVAGPVAGAAAPAPAGAAGSRGATLAAACALDRPFQPALLPLLLLLGADADAALARLCSLPGLLGDSMLRGREQKALDALLAQGAESSEGAAAGLKLALQNGLTAQTRALLRSGAVSQKDCAAVLMQVPALPAAAAGAGQGQGHGVEDGSDTEGENGDGDSGGSGNSSSSDEDNDTDNDSEGGEGHHQPQHHHQQQPGGGPAGQAGGAMAVGGPPASNGNGGGTAGSMLSPTERIRLSWALQLAKVGALPQPTRSRDAGGPGTSSDPPVAQSAAPGPSRVRGGACTIGVAGGGGSSAGSNSARGGGAGVILGGVTGANGAGGSSAGASGSNAGAGGSSTSGSRVAGSNGGGAGGCWTVDGALFQACDRGDVATIKELVCWGLAGEAVCTEAFWRAVRAGHGACAEVLGALGAVPPEVEREGMRQLEAAAGASG